MRPNSSDIALRRCVFAISVLDEVDVLPLDDGVQLGGVPIVMVGWDELWLALGATDPATLAGRQLVAQWLQRRRWLADRPYGELRELARPVALPVGHVLHPGPDWPRERILGDALDVGLGFAGLDPTQPDAVVITPTALLRGAGIEPSLCWHDARLYLERMAALALLRWRRSPTEVLRPMGDCDVVTLLSSPTLRAALCADTGGMRAVVVPMRTRGWVDLSHIDPAFAIAAAAASQPEDCGFPRGLLITADEVVMVQAGGRPHDLPLRDPGITRPQHLRPVLYHR